MSILKMFGMVFFWFYFILYGMVAGCCMDFIPCKVWKSYFEKQLSYGQCMEIWFGLAWSNMVTGWCLDLLPCRV